MPGVGDNCVSRPSIMVDGVTYTEPAIPLEPFEDATYRRGNRNTQWKKFASDIAPAFAGRSMVIRGTIRRICALEAQYDKEGWPGPVLPDPIPCVAEAA